MYIPGKGKWTKVTTVMGLSAFLLFSQTAMAMPRATQEASVPSKAKLILPQVTNIKKVPASKVIAPSRAKTATTNTAFNPTRILKAGVSGDDVKKLQTLLRKLGFFTGKIDGKFGSSTESAVIDFQKAASLKASGLVAELTVGKLNSKGAPSKAKKAVTSIATNSTYFKPNRVLKAGISGDDVKQLQTILQKLGFFTSKVDGKFGASTQSAVIDFQKAASIKASGLVAEITVNKLNSKGAPSRKGSTRTIAVTPPKTTVPKSNPVPTSTNNNKPIQEAPKGSVEMMPWSQVNGLFARKSKVRMIDVDTGKSITVYRYGGQNHADVEPVTAEDTAILKAMYGGSITSYLRAVIVEINGHRIAASIYGVPHGGEDIMNNDFSGQFCIHFLGSKTHNSNRVDPDHQAMVRKAGAVQ